MNVLRHWPEEDIGRIANRLPVPTAPWSSRETVRKVLETADVVPASQLAGAVSLLDDLSDVLAEVQRGELPVDDARVNDVLRRSVLHVNGGQSDLEFRQIAASDHTA
jgi:hypothetical protein